MTSCRATRSTCPAFSTPTFSHPARGAFSGYVSCAFFPKLSKTQCGQLSCDGAKVMAGVNTMYESTRVLGQVIAAVVGGQ